MLHMISGCIVQLSVRPASVGAFFLPLKRVSLTGVGPPPIKRYQRAVQELEEATPVASMSMPGETANNISPQAGVRLSWARPPPPQFFAWAAYANSTFHCSCPLRQSFLQGWKPPKPPLRRKWSFRTRSLFFPTRRRSAMGLN